MYLHPHKMYPLTKCMGQKKITNRKQNPCNFFFQKLIKSILNVYYQVFRIAKVFNTVQIFWTKDALFHAFSIVLSVSNFNRIFKYYSRLSILWNFTKEDECMGLLKLYNYCVSCLLGYLK